MKTTLIFLTLFIGSNCFYAQDTTYFDESWVICPKKKATYYRIAVKCDSLFQVNDYYINGVLQMTGTYTSLTPKLHEGYFTFYYKSGKVSKEGLYHIDKKQDEWKYYDEQGRLERTEQFRGGRFEGDVCYFYPDGKIRRKDNYSYDQFMNGRCFGRSGQDTAYYPHFEDAAFVGGNEVMNDYIVRNLRYPMKAVIKGIEGKVYVKFRVNAKGEVGKITIIRSDHKVFNKEVIRMLSAMPSWIPAKLEGVPIDNWLQIPINFTLQ